MGGVPSRQFTNLAAFIDATANDFAGFAFRGQGNPAWSLVPAIDRMAGERRSAERDLVAAFKERAQSFLHVEPPSTG